MLLGVMSASVFAETEEAAINITINDLSGNTVNITASAEKQANVILASYKGGKVVNVKVTLKTLTEGTNDYTVDGFEKGAGDIVKAYVWDNSPAHFAPLCKSFEKLQISASGSVEVGNNFSESGALIQAGDSISANVPKGVALADNAETLTLTVTTKENSDSNITLSDAESMLALDVHIEGIAENNTVPITVDLGAAFAKGLNSTSIKLYHVEDGKTNQMAYVANDAEFSEHNQFKYDPETGRVVLYLATFSEIVTVTNEVNAWMGGVDTSWYTKDEAAEVFTISNADQFAGLGDLVCAGTDFLGKTIVLTNDINMGGEDYKVNGKLQFYPIGYTSEGYQGTAFKGTFDGAGHKISNVRQNTWEMLGHYDGNYYNAAMGVFGYIIGATIKNLTVDNFSCESEFGTAGVIANCANGTCNFENIAIINCKPYTYNNNCAGILATDGGSEGNNFTFKNITIDNTNTIGALWGTWDGVCAGIMCSLKETTTVRMENCHVAARLDVYNDVCGNYQYYWYRYSGMLIGRVRKTVKWNGYDIPDLSKVTATNCTVNFGDWNDYYYCEIEANTQASYTVDYQMSRLTKVKSVVGNVVTYLDDTTETITEGSGYRHFVVVNNSNDPEDATCYHFYNGSVYNHTENEDKQHIYLPFNQLFTGSGWGIRGIDLKDLGLEGITILGITPGEDESVDKFEAKKKDYSYVNNGASYSLGNLFNGIAPENIPINDSSVVVSITSVDTNEVAGTYTPDVSDWRDGTIRFNSDEGLVKITIQDYQFCNPTTLYLYVIDDEILSAITAFNSQTSNNMVGRIYFRRFLTEGTAVR